ncbi:serine/threonine-protein kinase [Roseiconus lacunae]|uniref:serine/threonine-protein kinase n=1 Tax=Roseiconus lacunae TaxID=2605694 RepID=UPI001E47637D|nr:serine/threonine-protein kinase [Roseiconus lacunae]MCD0457914.1 protein kinase [Roseiconus lacunae]
MSEFDDVCDNFRKPEIESSVRPGCPSDKLLAGYIDGSLENDDLAIVDFHLEGCVECLDRLQAINDSDPLVARLRDFGMTEGEGPEREIPESSRYLRLEVIGEGGMGTVWRAQDQQLKRSVALKILRHRYLDRCEAVVERFRREAATMASLQHPGVPSVYEVGRFADDSNYIAMRLVEGETLSKVLAGSERNEESLSHLLNIFANVCQTVAYAHSIGIVHRDLKPSNIMVGKFGETQVMDWGIAKLLEDGDELTGEILKQDRFATYDGTVTGTPGYMAPEQAMGRSNEVNRATDVFALGAILFEVLVGRRMLADAGTTTELLESPIDLDRNSVQQALVDADVPAELSKLMMQCIQIDPGLRPQSAEVIAQAVTDYIESIPKKLVETQIENAAQEARFAEIFKRRRRWSVVTAVIAVLLSVCLFLALERRNYLEFERVKATNTIRSAIQFGRGTLHIKYPASDDQIRKVSRAITLLRNTPDSELVDPAYKRQSAATLKQLEDERRLRRTAEAFKQDIEGAQFDLDQLSREIRMQGRVAGNRRLSLESSGKSILVEALRFHERYLAGPAARHLTSPSAGQQPPPGRGFRPGGPRPGGPRPGGPRPGGPRPGGPRPSGPGREPSDGLSSDPTDLAPDPPPSAIEQFESVRNAKCEAAFANLGVVPGQPVDEMTEILREQSQEFIQLFCSSMDLWLAYACESEQAYAPWIAASLSAIEKQWPIGPVPTAPTLAWRNAVRHAIAERDYMEVSKLATNLSSSVFDEHPPELLWSVGKIVEQHDETQGDLFLRTASAVFPNHYLLNRQMALATSTRHMVGECLGYCTRALALRPDMDVSVILARSLFRMSRRHEAMVVINQMLEHYPDDSGYHGRIGALFLMHGQLGAVPLLERAIELGSLEEAKLWAILGAAQESSGKYDLAAIAYQKSLTAQSRITLLGEERANIESRLKAVRGEESEIDWQDLDGVVDQIRQQMGRQELVAALQSWKRLFSEYPAAVDQFGYEAARAALIVHQQSSMQGGDSSELAELDLAKKWLSEHFQVLIEDGFSNNSSVVGRTFDFWLSDPLLHPGSNFVQTDEGWKKLITEIDEFQLLFASDPRTVPLELPTTGPITRRNFAR